LPNEIWIHEGESITWAFQKDEIHTVSFLEAGQVRLPFQVGCPGLMVNNASFGGSTCVTTPPLVKGQTFTVQFPLRGNYKVVCLVHENVTGVVHVLEPAATLPLEQSDYDENCRAAEQALACTHGQGSEGNVGTPSLCETRDQRDRGNCEYGRRIGDLVGDAFSQ